MEHDKTHEGCKNNDYKSLPAISGDDEPQLVDAKAKANELLQSGFPEVSTEDDTYRLLHDCACIMHTAGRMTRILAIAPFAQTALRQGTLRYYLAVMEATEQFQKDLISVTKKLSNWVSANFSDTSVDCILEKMGFIYSDGMRQGDNRLWKSCFNCHTKADSDSETESRRTSTIPSGAESFFLRLGGSKILAVSIPGEPDKSSVDYVSQVLSELIFGQSSREALLASFAPPSSAASDAASGNVPTYDLADLLRGFTF